MAVRRLGEGQIEVGSTQNLSGWIKWLSTLSYTNPSLNTSVVRGEKERFIYVNLKIGFDLRGIPQNKNDK